MKVSTKKQTELYDAIAKEIMDYRIKVVRCTIEPDQVEKDLFYLTNRIWANVEKVLGIEG